MVARTDRVESSATWRRRCTRSAAAASLAAGASVLSLRGVTAAGKPRRVDAREDRHREYPRGIRHRRALDLVHEAAVQGARALAIPARVVLDQRLHLLVAERLVASGGQALPVEPADDAGGAGAALVHLLALDLEVQLAELQHHRALHLLRGRVGR